ncbi:hypothetical protein N7450_010176 [Penicillium hetheringtonii]|uniref:Uncharacterized protein n=1 Tax=Penicillium hetheringtonii TaxID=911720 RepID=A0AAD6DCD2_9EURO|nr:hypothetical protein N7450_010176 [Penicillium hetheringtonii]
MAWFKLYWLRDFTASTDGISCMSTDELITLKITPALRPQQTIAFKIAEEKIQHNQNLEVEGVKDKQSPKWEGKEERM